MLHEAAKDELATNKERQPDHRLSAVPPEESQPKSETHKQTPTPPVLDEAAKNELIAKEKKQPDVCSACDSVWRYRMADLYPRCRLCSTTMICKHRVESSNSVCVVCAIKEAGIKTMPCTECKTTFDLETRKCAWKCKRCGTNDCKGVGRHQSTELCFSCFTRPPKVKRICASCKSPIDETTGRCSWACSTCSRRCFYRDPDDPDVCSVCIVRNGRSPATKASKLSNTSKVASSATFGPSSTHSSTSKPPYRATKSDPPRKICTRCLGLKNQDAESSERCRCFDTSERDSRTNGEMNFGW